MSNPHPLPRVPEYTYQGLTEAQRGARLYEVLAETVEMGIISRRESARLLAAGIAIMQEEDED